MNGNNSKKVVGKKIKGSRMMRLPVEVDSRWELLSQSLRMAGFVLNRFEKVLIPGHAEQAAARTERRPVNQLRLPESTEG